MLSLRHGGKLMRTCVGSSPNVRLALSPRRIKMMEIILKKRASFRMRSPSQHSMSNLNIAKDDDFDSDSSSNTDTTTDNVARNYKSAVIRRQRSTTIETAQRSTRALQPQSSLARRVLTERRFGQDGALHAVEAISDGASKLVHYLRLGETARGALSDAGLSHAGTSINPQTRDTVHADAKVKCIPVSNSVDAKNRLSQLHLATDNLCREAPHGNDIQ